jgi:hypothetical protein
LVLELERGAVSEITVTVSLEGLETNNSPFAESYAMSNGAGPALLVPTTELVESEIIAVLFDEGVTTKISPFAES